jgi:hypothetical protein
MDFNKWIFEGVTYINGITEREWEKRLAAVYKKDCEREDARAERETKGKGAVASKPASKSRESKSKGPNKDKDEEKEGASGGGDGKSEEVERKPIVLSRPDDITFVAEAVKKLEAWLADVKAPDE